MNKKSNCQRASEAYVKTRRNKAVGAMATAGAALLALNLSTDANAAIVSGTNFNVNGFSMESPTLPGSASWNVGAFDGYYPGYNDKLYFSLRATYLGLFAMRIGGDVNLVDSGYQISAGRTWGFSTTWNWSENGSESGYLGVRFIVGWDPVLGDIFRYGWLEASLNAAGDAITLHRWAYEDVAGQAITAGDTGAPVPIPGSLALLASGAAGLVALRRRKAAAA